MRCLALASYDSFLNAARLIAPYFRDAGCSVEYALVRARTRQQITPQQIDRLAFSEETRWLTIENARDLLSEVDIVLSCLEGLSTRRLMHYVQSLNKRPLIISAYPGLVLRHANDGFSMRTASDLLWLNSRVDLNAYRDLCAAFRLPADNARVFGVASLLRRLERKPDAREGPIVFFEQAIIPRHYDERAYLCGQLIRLARKFPQYEFILKPRVVGPEATLHRSWYPIAPLFEEVANRLGPPPPNLKISTTDASALLETASHCLTVSSTVAVEAVNAGIPTAIIGDFGAHEEYGLQYFFRSGLITSFDDLTFPFTSTVNVDWRDAHFTDPHTTVERLVSEAITLAGGEKRKLAPQMQSGEMSQRLREYLLDLNGVEKTLSRKHQDLAKPYARILNKLTAVWLFLRDKFAAIKRKP